jgi:hypothetical protein
LAAPEQQAEQKHQGDSGGHPAPGQRRQQRLEVLGEDHSAECDRGAEREPVAPAHDKPRIPAESPAHEYVLAAGPGDHRAGLRQGDGPEQGIETANHPDADEKRRTGQLSRYLTRRAEDPDDDGTADEHRDAEGDAEDPAQRAPAGRRDQTGCPGDATEAIGGIGQLEVLRRAGV